MDHTLFDRLSLITGAGNRVWETAPKRRVGDQNRDRGKKKSNTRKDGDEEDVVVSIGQQGDHSLEVDGSKNKEKKHQILWAGKIDIKV